MLRFLKKISFLFKKKNLFNVCKHFATIRNQPKVYAQSLCKMIRQKVKRKCRIDTLWSLKFLRLKQKKAHCFSERYTNAIIKILYLHSRHVSSDLLKYTSVSTVELCLGSNKSVATRAKQKIELMRINR